MSMLPKKSLVFALVAGSVAFGVTAVADSRGERVVATVGDTTLTVADVEARIARVPAFRLRELGATPDEQRKKVLEQLLDIELLAQGARSEKLDERDDVAMRLRRVLVGALEAQFREDALASAEVSNEAIRAYYEANHGRFAAESRLKIWQLVVKTREDADKVLKEIQGDKAWDSDAIGKWDDLVRKWSIDKTTSMKKGNLGFVSADGTTQDSGVRVNPALFTAASKLSEGQIATEPVQDGDVWVVVSRRGTMNTPERSLDSEASTIRSFLAKQQLAQRMDAKLQELRKKYVQESHPERLGDVTIDVGGAVSSARRPGSLPHLHKAEKPGAPHEHDHSGNLR
jgi:peptidyl-prolyl cis-trans isomerase C